MDPLQAVDFPADPDEVSACPQCLVVEPQSWKMVGNHWKMVGSQFVGTQLVEVLAQQSVFGTHL
jgi:hypothetical protein